MLQSVHSVLIGKTCPASYTTADALAAGDVALFNENKALIKTAAEAATASSLYVGVAGLALMAVATTFSFITLPVEYDASNRALAWLKNKNMLGQEEYAGAEDSLKWAARTYLVAALGALASLLYWAYRILGSRD